MNERNLNFIEDLCKRPEVDDWRHLIKKDANNFYKFCVKFQLVPNVFVLHEWWNWSTPVTLGHKLFDTILYVTFLQRRLTSTVDNSEVCRIEVRKLIYKTNIFVSRLNSDRMIKIRDLTLI